MTDDTPPPEELARIEAEKAKLRQQHLDAILARRNGTYKDEVGDVATMTTPQPRARPASSGTCPDCGRPYGKIRRCFACKPTNPKTVSSSAQGPAPAKPSTRAPVAPVVSRPVPLPVEVRESTAVPVPARPMTLATLTTAVAALQGIVDLLAGLDDDVARWALESAHALLRLKDQETRP